HGWSRPSDRQHLHRTVVANGEIRRGLSEGLRGRVGRAIELETVFHLPQRRTSTSSLGLSNAGDRPRGAMKFSAGFTKKEKRSKKERKLRKGKLVETVAAVEIDKGSLRRLLLDDFHRCLKKPA